MNPLELNKKAISYINSLKKSNVAPLSNNQSNMTNNWGVKQPIVSKIQTTNESATSPKSNFINSVVKPTTPNYYDVNTGRLTEEGRTAGMKDINAPKEVTPIPTTSIAPKETSEESAYIKYLRTMFNPKELKTAQQNVTNLNQRIASENKRAREQEDIIRKNETGGLSFGQNFALGELGRKSAQTLADLSTTKGTAVDIYNQMLDAGASVYEAEEAAKKANEPINVGGVLYQKQEDGTYKAVTPTGSETAEGFTLSPGEIRYDAQGNVVATGGTKPLSAIQEAKLIADQEKQISAQQQASQALGLVNNLISGDRYKAISGGLQTGSIPFLGDRTAVNEYNQLQGMLKLGIRGMLKGQGTISDYEGKILGQAASSLSRLTDEKQMKQALQTVRGVLKTNNGQTTTVDVKSPEGETLKDVELSGSEIYQLVSEGNTITYK